MTRTDGSPETSANVGLRVTLIEHDMGLQNVDATRWHPGRTAEVVILTRQGREIRQVFTLPIATPSP